MATSETVAQAATNTLDGSAADTITLNQPFDFIAIAHHGTATDPIYFKQNGAATEAGDNCNVVLSGTTTVIRAQTGAVTAGKVVVSIISGGANVYTLMGL